MRGEDLPPSRLGLCPKRRSAPGRAWSRHPQGNLAVFALRMMALCIMALARKLSRFGYGGETPSWGQVAEHFLLDLCASNLETKAFDTV